MTAAKMLRIDLSSNVGNKHAFGVEPDMILLITPVVIILKDWSVLGAWYM